jgi:hypothetical protein
LLQSHLSTEICYDLECAIRQTNNSYPKNLKIHVVPSNVLTFQNRHYIALPDHGKIVIHADPLEKTLIYEKSPVIQAGIKNLNINTGIKEFFESYCSQKWLSTKESLPNILLFSIDILFDGSLYKIKIFNLAQKLQ